MSNPNRAVLRFLASIGRPAEAELYLSLYRAERPESFAVIAVDPEVLGVAGDALAVDLEFLAELGLSPILALAAAGQAAQLAGGLARLTEASDPAGAAEIARRGRIPIVLCAGDAELGALAAALATRKLVLVGPHGRMMRGGEPVSIVDLTSEYDQLAAPGVLSEPHRRLLERARALLDAAGHPMTVAVTSPLELLRELFTVRGAGTLVRRGTAVATHRDWTAVDRARLAALVEAAFGRPLRAEFWSRPIERVYVAGDYRGAAVVSPTAEGPYLSKLAVDAPARGEGIGRDLWRALCRDYPSFYWRARAGNPIASWYQEQCDGMVKRGAWRVYWRGLDPARIAAAVVAAESAPVDFD
jgi:GNAT superfamily N-acetyltransferase